MSPANILIFNVHINSNADTQFLLSKNPDKRLNLIEINEQLCAKVRKQEKWQSQRKSSGAGFLRKAKSVFLNWGKEFEIIRALYLIWSILRDTFRVRTLFDRYKPELLILFDDRPAHPNLVILSQARHRNIPVLLIPMAQSAIKNTYLFRYGQDIYQLERCPWKGLKSWLYRHYPNHFQAVSSDQFLCFYRPLDVLVLIFFKILPRQPWIWGGSGMADHFCAPNRRQFEEMRAYGVPENQLTLTGQSVIDSIFKGQDTKSMLRKDLNETYQLNAQKKLLICAVPHYGEHGFTDWPDHWRLTEELFSELAKSNHEALLSLHPKSLLSNYQPLAQKYNLAILKCPISEVLMAADLQVGTNSSVIAWGLGAGVPAIMIDPFNMDTFYGDLESVIKIDNHRELGETIDTVFTPENYIILQQNAKTEADWLGRFDGQNTARIFEQIHRMVGGTAKPE